MRTFLAHDRLQLLFVVLGVATCTWRGLAVALLIAALIACRRLVRRRLPTWLAGTSVPAGPSAATVLAQHTATGPLP